MLKQWTPIVAALAVTLAGAAQQREWTPHERLICMTQERLAELGWSRGAATGKMDEPTRDALGRYQKFVGLEVTGETSEKVLAWLTVPCQIKMETDFYTGASKSQMQFGCRNLQAEAIGVGGANPVASGASAARGPTCGRSSCVPPKVTPATLDGTPLRFDGLYADQAGGLSRFIRFYPDGTVASANYALTPYEVACALTREAATKAGAPPQPYGLEGNRIRFRVTSNGKLRAMSGTLQAGRLQLVYDDEAALFVTNTMSFGFFPDPH